MQSQNIALFILFSLGPAVAQGAKDQQCDTKECAADTGSLLMTNKIVTELSTDTELANKDNEGKMLVQGRCAKDNDKCLATSPAWNENYNCANSEQWCDSYKKDMHRCCSETCKVAPPCTKAACESLGTNGDCVYPNLALVPITTTPIPTTTIVAQNEAPSPTPASDCVKCDKLRAIKEQLEDALKDCPEAPSPTPASSCPHGDGKAFPGKHVGYKLICFQGEPFEFVEGAPTPTFENGYVNIPGGCCSGENQLNKEADLAPKHEWGGLACSGQDDCYSGAKQWCDSNPSCVSFELWPGWPKSDTEAPYQVSFSSSCQQNGYPPDRRLNLYGAKGCDHDLYIKLPLAQPTAKWLQPGTDSYRMTTNYVMGTLGANECPDGSKIIETLSDCKDTLEEVGFRHDNNLNWMKNNMARDSKTYPKGCYRHASGENVYYNADASGGAPNDDATPICRIVS